MQQKLQASAPLFLVSSLFDSDAVIYSYLRLERNFCSMKSCKERTAIKIDVF